MNALILAAGKGTRMEELTKDKNKCMIEINDISLIIRLIKILLKNGIENINIVTGYKSKELKEHINKELNNLSINYIENLEYNNSNNIYSMYLAREKLKKDDTLIIESDLIFEEDIIKKLKESKNENIACVSKYKNFMDGTVVKVEKNKITEFIQKIDKKYERIDRTKYYKTVNIYKVSKNISKEIFVPKLEEYINNCRVNEYYESVFEELTTNKKMKFDALIVEKEQWYEIDTNEDLNEAKKFFCKTEQIKETYGGYWRYQNLKDFCYFYNSYFDISKFCKDTELKFNQLIKNYPSSLSVQNEMAARLYNISKENIIVGNGAAELINALGKLIKGKMLVNVPTFNEYIRCFTKCRIIKNSLSNTNYKIDIQKIIKKANEVDAICLIVPDNPTGQLIKYSDLINLLEKVKCKRVKVIVDESLMDFVQKDARYTLIKDEILEKYPNLIVIKSLSKTYNIPGLRLGILATSNKDIIENLKKELPIWNINSISENFLENVNKYKKDYEEALEKINKQKNIMEKELQGISYLKVFNSYANFIMCELKGVNSTILINYLLEEHGILIKDLKNKEGLENKNYVRIAVRGEEDNKLLIEALKKYNPPKKKILYSAILNSHILNFHLPYLKWLKENNYEVYVITKDKGDIPFCDVKIEIDFPKGINIIKTIKAISKVKEIIESEKFDIIQLNTSIDSAIIRYAYKKSNIKSKIIYTMHNLYIYKNAGILNYLIYYPIEKYLSKIADTLVAINDEDYEFCKNKFKAKKIIKINGIGIDINKFECLNDNVREKIGLKETDYVIVYPAEIRKRKNQMLVIKAMKKLVKKHNNIYLLLIGKDSTNGKYIKKVKRLGLEKNIFFLGYKDNVLDYLKMADLQISTSKQEGLPIGILEGIFIENKIIATKARGNTELVIKYNKGILLKRNTVKNLVKEIETVFIGEKLNEEQSNKDDFKKYTLNNVMPQYIKLFGEEK